MVSRTCVFFVFLQYVGLRNWGTDIMLLCVM